MMALAGYPLGLEFLFLDRDARTPGGQVGPILEGALTDRELLGQPQRTLRRRDLRLGEHSRSRRWKACPARRASPRRCARSRPRRTGSAKSAPSSCSASPTTRYAAVDSRAALEAAVQAIGLPGVLKTRTLGYDGKGQFVLRTAADLDARLGGARQRAAALREPGAVRQGSLDHRGARPGRRHRLLSTQPERAPRRHPAPDARALRQCRAHAPGTTRRAPPARAFQLRGRAHHRVLRVARQAHRQRNGAARAQLRALDHRRRGHQPVRKSRPRHCRPAARQHPAARALAP